MAIAAVFSLTAILWPADQEAYSETQPVLLKEEIGGSTQTLYVQWPTYAGVVRMPVFSTFTAQVYHE